MADTDNTKDSTDTDKSTPTPNDVVAAVANKPDADHGRKGGQVQMLADLNREREARKALEGQVSQMRDAFAQALGMKPDAKADVEQIVGDFKKRLDAMQHETNVERVARVNGITDDDDLALLRATRDEDQMTKLAVRLKAASEPAAPGTPKPDRTQGPQGSDNKPDPGPGVPRLAQAFEDALNQ